jgi:predicted  nucleic acid-binding Zn-ribbon protein
VNPQWHDEFVALCALFPSGELTEEEWALLQVHLAYCDSCRVAFREYEQIASDVVPIMAASAATESDSKPGPSAFSIDAAEQRLMGHLSSAPVDQVSAPSRRLPWQVSAGALAACVAVAAVVGSHRYRSTAGTQKQQNTNIVALVEPKKPVVSQPSDQTNLRSELEHTQLRVADLEQQVNVAKGNLQQSNASVTRMQQQIETETAERKKTSDERDQLSQQLVAAQTEAQSLRDKTAATNTAAAQQGARTTSLEAQLHDANAALEEKDRLLALDKEFLAHDREIRDLIGARDLYIADIYDVAQNGKTNKPFGRIFYTKDKSLVFYGYDLDKQSGLKQSVAFQAWGSGDDKQDVSLGLFYQDDTHKRWVLRFNDTKTLAHLNKVFVTAEPQGGSAKPTGKPLLLAYLQIQPNHP